ncbi:hypothetical protein QL285_046835 [Trifolium repens]|nr:hypothetical protein QL285_046835 [Trifolium repens]
MSFIILFCSSICSIHPMKVVTIVTINSCTILSRVSVHSEYCIHDSNRTKKSTDFSLMSLIVIYHFYWQRLLSLCTQKQTSPCRAVLFCSVQLFIPRCKCNRI